MTSQDYRNSLNTLLNNDNSLPNQITVARGRLIVALNREYAAATDPAIKNDLQNEIKNEMIIHHQQLNDRLMSTKQNNQNLGLQVANEIGLKARKIANSIHQLQMSETPGEYLANSAKIVGNTLSTAFSVVKAPIVISLNLVGMAAPIVGTIAVQPLQIPAYLFSKIINPDGQYNGQVITNMGRELGNIVSNGINLSADAIRRV